MEKRTIEGIPMFHLKPNICGTYEDYEEDQRVRNKDWKCVVCGINSVSPADGEDTCPDCLGRI
jgi:rubrerythrin